MTPDSDFHIFVITMILSLFGVSFGWLLTLERRMTRLRETILKEMQSVIKAHEEREDLQFGNFRHGLDQIQQSVQRVATDVAIIKHNGRFSPSESGEGGRS